jgi:pimeloyl-ACP methyl ester carboxylesterase
MLVAKKKRMNSLRDATQVIEISGVAVEVVTIGEGRELLFLHGAEGLVSTSARHLLELARNFRVIAPLHPGFGFQPRPDELREVSDLAYLYLDLAEHLELDHAVLVGASFGGWIAAEMLVRNARAFGHLALSAPLGIKVRGREDRDIADFFAMTEDEFCEIAYADPTKGRKDLSKLDDDELARHFRSRETLAYFGWRPYMHNPQLRRWLHRIVLPTLIAAGAQDRFVFDGYHEAYQASLPRSTLSIIDRAGHFPHVEQPEQFAEQVVAHCRSGSFADAA